VSRRIATALSVLMGLACLWAPAVLADGDPASDVLLGENVFYPYQPPVSSSVQKALNGATAQAKHAGFPVKVALIAAPVDLGVIPDLFGKPQKYADFLDQEISFQGAKQPLLVVMSTGYGVQGIAPKTAAVLSSLAKPAGRTSTDLARAALTAVQKMASASGHPLSGQPAKSSGGGSSGVLIGVLAGVAVAIALGLATLTLRRRRAPA
jgi:hypothetical protein